MRKQKGSETLLFSIFDGFGSHLGLPKRSQDAQKLMLKWQQKASRNTSFSAQERQDASGPHVLESAWRNVQVAWGGLRRGKTDVQAPRTFESGTWSKEGDLEGQEELDRVI